MNFDQLLEVNKYNKNFEIWKLKIQNYSGNTSYY